MKNQKHILFISSWYPNRNNPTHGIFNAYLARAANLYNRVSVIHVCSDNKLKQDFEQVNELVQGIHTIVVYYKKVSSNIPVISQFQKRAKYLQAFDLAYDELLSKQGPVDLIQLNVVLPAGIAVLHLSKKHNIPYVVNENWSGYTKEDGNYKGSIQKYFTKKIIQQALKIMPTSTYLQEAMLAHGLTGSYEVVPNVVDVNKFIPTEVTKTKAIKFIHISSLIEREKNVSGILKAFQKALTVNNQLQLEIVGDGVNKLELQQLAKELNISSHVFFKGRLEGDDLIKCITKSTALIMFSYFETFCLVIIEAFACGKPVITSNAGAIPSYMNDKLGYMVERNNIDELASAILKLANNDLIFDPKYIRHFAENYSYEKVGMQLNHIYNKVLINA